MGEQNDLRAVLAQRLDRRKHAFDARRIGHGARFDGDIEIGTDENAFAFHIEPIDGLDAGKIYIGHAVPRCHSRRPIATAVSLIRLEKPHSLSYQATTRQNVPSMTCVPVKSKTELRGS